MLIIMINNSKIITIPWTPLFINTFYNPFSSFLFFFFLSLSTFTPPLLPPLPFLAPLPLPLLLPFVFLLHFIFLPLVFWHPPSPRLLNLHSHFLPFSLFLLLLPLPTPHHHFPLRPPSLHYPPSSSPLLRRGRDERGELLRMV